ncbi:MAG TPA: zinc-binding dehydrogenase [Candidatus Nanoarchaeia archaeon]|nr:zinc-binding dehydrogenase [Candidatus Naiadarchaeales archaeon SRR2090153.bin461]HLC81842.1 zinc-binding dehydrogenase [Candidatus Nanoarchaeia archaeon]
MKAVFFEKTGGLNVLKYGDFSTPRPQQGEALVRVKACALNRLDVWLREDVDNARNIPLPHIPGSDVAGIIEEINGESSLKVGQEVVLNPATPCESCPRCRNKVTCELVRIFGVKNQGGYAEYVTAPIKQLYPKPKNISFVEAAAFPLTFLTAWHMLVGRANLKKGETVFIWGASGGLGSSAIEVAKYLGAKIIAAAKSESDAQKIKEIGADEVVIYTKGNVEDEVKKMTGGLGVDVVFESVGEKTWNTTLSMLRPYGRVVIAGTTSGDKGTQDLSDIYVRQLSIFGARMGTKEEFEKVLELVSAGKLKPIVDKVFSLKEAADAQRRMVEGKHVGKIIFEI